MRITILGSGNVATHLAAALKNAGHAIWQVYSPHLDHAALLAYHVKAEAVNDINAIKADADLYIISVKDDAIITIASQLAVEEKPVVHTSGATPLAALKRFGEHSGVFYPLQTFSKQKEVNFREVPLCIEAASESVRNILTHLGRDISNRVYEVSTEQRKILHLSAVFACNFPNYLYEIARGLLAANGLDFDLLRPLVLETADKVQHSLPNAVQTGPAVRNDEKTMQAHLGMLQDDVFLQNIYRLLSEGITKMKSS
ncbi:DUF2520 domain-containing protein [Mucilaginibacter sp. RS28]|uniref:DUF2520 domain-containing protein n=1 Tax=Mucilaginibacter straminoryzae TaxID=2932774 RepID=A0A9X1X2N2_9SPHI|nr:Rossmann-like and DUF2520 domain-containing protein [Mucilaginibacter straminoryzae]MCJ8209888.1 DUF2520 domain-containing protein [Mucilaginibacter straminoryzae]